jgi:hypothetical protein
MKRAEVFSIALILIVLAASVALLVSSQSNTLQNDVYVGVAFGGTTVEQARILIDRVKSYTNLFVLDCGLNPISSNQSAVEEISDYAVDAGLHIIVNLGTWTNQNDWAWKLAFFNNSRLRYGDMFLGVYYDDEPGGIPLDWNWPDYFTKNSPLFSGVNPLSLIPIHYKMQLAQITGQQPDNYAAEAAWFNQLVSRNRGHTSLNQYNITTFTSDYALYWFDYLGGYDTLFTQLGLNETSNTQIEGKNAYQSTTNQQIAFSLLRGAATMQNKDWGAIVTWTYNEPPYLDSGQNVYNMMKNAYNEGAKYIMLFDYPYNVTNPDGTLNQYGVLKDWHFQALQTFWNKVLTQPPTSPHAEAALVLPKDYGWGMRSANDWIWGFWGPDAKSPIIWNATQTLLGQYGSRLDIIYDDPAFPIQGNYSKIYYWNQTLS